MSEFDQETVSDILQFAVAKLFKYLNVSAEEIHNLVDEAIRLYPRDDETPPPLQGNKGNQSWGRYAVAVRANSTTLSTAARPST